MLKTILGDMFDIQEAARALNMKVTTLYQWNHRGTGPKYYRVGTKVGYKYSDLVLWMQERVGSK